VASHSCRNENGGVTGAAHDHLELSGVLTMLDVSTQDLQGATGPPHVHEHPWGLHRPSQCLGEGGKVNVSVPLGTRGLRYPSI